MMLIQRLKKVTRRTRNAFEAAQLNWLEDAG